MTTSSHIVEMECPEWGGVMRVPAVPADAATEVAAFSRDESLELALGAASNAAVGLAIRRLSSPAPLFQGRHAAIRYVPIVKPTAIALLPPVKARHRVTGIAAPFNSLSQIISGEEPVAFREMILRGAFADSLRVDDIEFSFPNHVDGILGSTFGRELKLIETDSGLWFQLDVPYGRPGDELLDKIRLRTFPGMSFRFATDDYEWRQHPAGLIRVLKKVTLRHISPATRPAFLATSIKESE